LRWSESNILFSLELCKRRARVLELSAENFDHIDALAFFSILWDFRHFIKKQWVWKIVSLTWELANKLEIFKQKEHILKYQEDRYNYFFITVT